MLSIAKPSIDPFLYTIAIEKHLKCDDLIEHERCQLKNPESFHDSINITVTV
jgi:hypothetical protein